MSFNLDLQSRCRRTSRMATYAAEKVRSMLEPFVLERLYPPTPVETEPGSGKWRNQYLIQPHQRKLHERRSINGKIPKHTLFSSGVGAGKSLTMCAEMMKLLRTYPGIQIVVVTAFDYYFDEFLMPIWNSILPEDSPHIKSSNKKSRSIVLTNGSRIRFKAYDDPDKIKGWQAHVIWIEEGSEIGDGNNDKAYAIWNALLMRLRASRPAYPLRTYITQNPKGHNWLWRIFIKDEPTKRQPLADIGRDTIFGYDAAGRPKYYTEWEKVTESGEIFYTIACPSTSNAFIPEGYIDSMLSQMSDDPGLRQRMVEGKFNPVNTLVYDYPIFSERTHVVDYTRFLEYWEIDEIPKWWRVVVGIDVGGSRSPWAVEYYVQTEDGHWACFDEIYQPNLTWDEICDRILVKSAGFENISYWIDPISSQHQQGPTNTTVQVEFRHRGIGTNTPKGYNKHGGIARVQNFLKRDHTQPCPYKDDILNEDDEGDPYWENGHSQLYYLTNMPHRVTERNPEGHSAPGNIKEKGVYRWDQAKARAAKATEEGLSPMVSTKLIDRDDHGQTAEMFFALGVNPIVKREPSDTARRKRQVSDQPNTTPIMYGRQKRKGWR